MNYFVYKGVRSSDMGLRIEKKEVFSAPKYDVEFLSIPGRSGDLIAGGGRFPNAQVTYSVFLPAKSIAELSQKITAVKDGCTLASTATTNFPIPTIQSLPAQQCMRVSSISRTN